MNPPQPALPRGQAIAAATANFIGSWTFIGLQAVAMLIWVLINTLAITQVIRFDPFPFVLLNLAMSAEAAYTGPLLLIATNVAAVRDRRQASHIEAMTESHAQQGTQLLALEQMLDGHIQATATELGLLRQLLESVHAHTGAGLDGLGVIAPGQRTGHPTH